MQIIYFSSALKNIFAIILLWTAIQLIVPLFCLQISDKWLSASSGFFKTYEWEKDGEFYNRAFKVKKWKRFLPDGGAVVKSGFKKRHIDVTSKENLRKFNTESCRAELVHWLLILPFWIIGFIAPSFVIPVMLLYALVANLPCIIAQRYNRPRISKLLAKIEARDSKKSKENL
ncbi:MAG: glycosyl-4,4'-diaponeurosporenoate acyltransferase [Clostridiales bacterium]|nr:glycosyl-4,4'-diaponeurosporenoate acyltransferase [Clostridiales bacterium]